MGKRRVRESNVMHRRAEGYAQEGSVIAHRRVAGCAQEGSVAMAGCHSLLN